MEQDSYILDVKNISLHYLLHNKYTFLNSNYFSSLHFINKYEKLTNKNTAKSIIEKIMISIS